MEAFVLGVLDIIAKADAHRDLWWRTDGKYAPVRFFINCNDVFVWGSSDAEDVTQERLPILRQAYKDSKHNGGVLYCARVRQLRPQGAYYTYIDKGEWPLFNAAGPERLVGPGNPYAPGGYKREPGRQEGG